MPGSTKFLRDSVAIAEEPSMQTCSPTTTCTSTSSDRMEVAHGPRVETEVLRKGKCARVRDSPARARIYSLFLLLMALLDRKQMQRTERGVTSESQQAPWHPSAPAVHAHLSNNASALLPFERSRSCGTPKPELPVIFVGGRHGHRVGSALVPSEIN